MSYETQIWIAGSNGRIGSELIKILNPEDYEILATDIDEVDITDSKIVNLYVDMHRPEIIINCAGITDLDYCEENLEEAFRVNAIGAKNLAIAATRINAKIIQLSTDDVFSGEGNKPYREYDELGARTVYGKSKVLAEEYIREFSQNYFILRSSWLYGGGNKYVENIISQAKENGVVKVANKQIGSPTSSKELAKFILSIIDSYNYGTYHVACIGQCSRKEFAQEILDILSIKAEVEEIEGLSGYSNRPEYSALDNFLLRISNMYIFPDWKTALKEYIKEVEK
ncbi:dTDP-4-dehydrorhamnose reductase [Miniphocaeibacter massiliensis]|uniref:dTDP-4-dehydrorhamnose reductase n=1 Tax=Miniphocaeibacter massiliensis TaxID=2041841 RepID=UPI000C1BC513|nr:dTDP-4-dehydrorhamnose reductase [Miniphocaeibacter massiliensis]